MSCSLVSASAHTRHLWQINPALSVSTVSTLCCQVDSFISRTGGVYLRWHQPASQQGRRVHLKKWEVERSLWSLCSVFDKSWEDCVGCKLGSKQNPHHSIYKSILNFWNCRSADQETLQEFILCCWNLLEYSEGSPEVSLCLSRTIPSNSPEPTLAVWSNTIEININ